MSNRASSVYTIRITHGATAEILQRIAAGLPNVADTGESSVSFRARSDFVALDSAVTAMDDGFPECDGCSLTTGLGIHRRVVAMH